MIQMPTSNEYMDNYMKRNTITKQLRECTSL